MPRADPDFAESTHPQIEPSIRIGDPPYAATVSCRRSCDKSPSQRLARGPIDHPANYPKAVLSYDGRQPDRGRREEEDDRS
jgi:hypothetical protein